MASSEAGRRRNDQHLQQKRWKWWTTHEVSQAMFVSPAELKNLFACKLIYYCSIFCFLFYIFFSFTLWNWWCIWCAHVSYYKNQYYCGVQGGILARVYSICNHYGSQTKLPPSVEMYHHIRTHMYITYSSASPSIRKYWCYWRSICDLIATLFFDFKMKYSAPRHKWPKFWPSVTSVWYEIR